MTALNGLCLMYEKNVLEEDQNSDRNNIIVFVGYGHEENKLHKVG